MTTNGQGSWQKFDKDNPPTDNGHYLVQDSYGSVWHIHVDEDRSLVGCYQDSIDDNVDIVTFYHIEEPSPIDNNI